MQVFRIGKVFFSQALGTSIRMGESDGHDDKTKLLRVAMWTLGKREDSDATLCFSAGRMRQNIKIAMARARMDLLCLPCLLSGD
jgi:hypothetical protein